MARFLLSLALCIVTYGSVMGQRDQCIDKKGGVVAHEKFCDFYYRCDREGQAHEERCPNGLAFVGKSNPLKEYCHYPHKASCPDGLRVMGQSPIAGDNCAWQYGIFAHETSCTSYWSCWNGTANLEKCPQGLLFSEDIHTCDWPERVADCQKHPLCKDNLNGNVVFGNSCDQYWMCVHGYPRKQSCPAGLAFNKETLNCEHAASVAGCEPKPAPIEDDEDGPVDPKSQPQSGGRP